MCMEVILLKKGCLFFGDVELTAYCTLQCVSGVDTQRQRVANYKHLSIACVLQHLVRVLLTKYSTLEPCADWLICRLSFYPTKLELNTKTHAHTQGLTIPLTVSFRNTNGLTKQHTAGRGWGFEALTDPIPPSPSTTL